MICFDPVPNHGFYHSLRTTWRPAWPLHKKPRASWNLRCATSLATKSLVRKWRFGTLVYYTNIYHIYIYNYLYIYLYYIIYIYRLYKYYIHYILRRGTVWPPCNVESSDVSKASPAMLTCAIFPAKLLKTGVCHNLFTSSGENSTPCWGISIGDPQAASETSIRTTQFGH